MNDTGVRDGDAAAGDGVDLNQATESRRRTTRLLRSPALAVLLVAPFFGEALSGATPPLELVQPWNLAFLAGLYGSGALICRELARRHGLGLLGLCLLGAAYGVYEEGLLDRYWYYPKFWDDLEIGSYSTVWHTNVLVAVHLTAFHTVVSICLAVLVVERLFPSRRDRAWAGNRGLLFAGITMGVVIPILYGEFDRGPGILVLMATAALFVLLIVAAFLSPRLPRRPVRAPATPRRGLGFIAFACTAGHWVIVYSLPGTDVPWPIGIALAVAPVALGVLVVHRMATGGVHGPDALRVITGILAFFIVLDIFVGLFGRYDMILGAIALAIVLRWLRSRERRRTVAKPG